MEKCKNSIDGKCHYLGYISEEIGEELSDCNGTDEKQENCGVHTGYIQL